MFESRYSEEVAIVHIWAKFPRRMCFASRNLDFGTWGRKTIFGLSGIIAPPAVVQVAEAHSKLRERDATGHFESLFALIPV
jgi:hypothetical protein